MAGPNLSNIFSKQELDTLRKLGYEIQPTADTERWKRLAEAYRTCGLWNERAFCCSSAANCDLAFKRTNYGAIPANRRGTVADYLAAYDLLLEGKPLRVCVVSLDSGSPVTRFEEHWKEAEGLLYNPIPGNWQHWLATLKLMNLVFFGEHDIDVNSTLLPRKLFTHVRVIKCNAGRKWAQPNEMFHNCLRHLEAELKVLEPTLIVAQGYAKNMSDWNPCVTWSVLKAMRNISGENGTDVFASLLSNSWNQRMIARRWVTPWGATIMLATYHPGAGRWYSDYQEGSLRNDLIPPIQELRKRKFTLD